jgi:LacI family transcriptional regulator
MTVVKSDAKDHEPGKRSTPTLRDVAERASVTSSTASVILSGGKRAEAYAAATRKRVELAARELGYSANFFARTLRQSHTRLIGAVLFSEQSPYYGRPLQGLRSFAQERDYRVVTADMGYQRERLEECVAMLAAWKVEAMVLMTGGQLAGPKVVEIMQRTGIPYVIGGLNIEQDSSSRLVFDNYSAGKLLAGHAVELGHRHMGILAAKAENQMSEERLKGILDTLLKHKITLNDQHIARLDTKQITVQASIKHAAQLLEKHPEITMLFCHNDIVAIGAMHAAAQLGRSVPGSLSIAGFDDICLHEVTSSDERLGEYLTPSLTTIRVPQVEMGRELGRLLVDLIEKPGRENARKTIEFSPELIVRGSTGPAPKGRAPR